MGRGDHGGVSRAVRLQPRPRCADCDAWHTPRQVRCAKSDLEVKRLREENSMLRRHLERIEECAQAAIIGSDVDNESPWYALGGVKAEASLAIRGHAGGPLCACGHSRSDHQTKLPAPCRHGAGEPPVPTAGECFVRAVDEWAKTGCQCLAFAPGESQRSGPTEGK